MTGTEVLLCLVLVYQAWCACALIIVHNASAARIAIIGAGVGGSTSAWFLREQLGPAIQIDVFEPGDIGGRTQVFEHEGSVYEMGASIIHGQNRYFRELADAMGLERHSLGSDDSLIFIYDGQRFVFKESSWTVVTLFRMLQRYGLNYLYMRRGPVKMLQRYLNLYKLQAEGRAFDTPEELLQAVDLYSLTQLSFKEDVKARLGSGPSAELFSKEFLAGIQRVNYNQGNGLNALAGMVSLLPTIDGRLFKIKGGNRLLPVGLLDRAGAKVYKRRVLHVNKTDKGTWLLGVDGAGSSKNKQAFSGYTAVLIAVPLELTNIAFSGFRLPHLPRRAYQTTWTTLVVGHLRPGYFGVQALHQGVTVMVTEDAQTPFSVVAPQRRLQSGLVVYKLFSQAQLQEPVLRSIFGNLTVLAQREWMAYPKFSPPEQFPPFQLADGLYLNNAWENAASAMEMSAVAAKNCALLIAKHVGKVLPSSLHAEL